MPTYSGISCPLKVGILVLTKKPRVRIEPSNRVLSVPPRLLAWPKMKMNSSIICSQKPRNAVEVSLASFRWKALYNCKKDNTKYISSHETEERCCYTEIACNSPYDGFCLNKGIGPASQCPSGKFVKYEFQTCLSFPELIAFSVTVALMWQVPHLCNVVFGPKLRNQEERRVYLRKHQSQI